jgi:ATP-dependent 26S proteasome regulatory subunit
MGLLDWCVGLGSVLASFFIIWRNKVDNYADPIFRLTTWVSKLAFRFSPYLQLTISEYGAERFQRSEFFLAVEAYLSKACAQRAHKLKADMGRHKLQVNVDDHEEVVDTYGSATVWWYASKQQPSYSIISFNPAQEETRFYQVVFHRRDRDLIINDYLPYVFDEGSDASIKNRPRRLFTNKPSTRWNPGNASWSHVAFQHPATFDTLAMDPKEKGPLLDDLQAFQNAKDYYRKVGKAWKRGYLLYGPPGTGKSTMIAAMANFLDYDVYDLELTAVKNNTELRKLFIETKSRSIIVIEDIDCSVELTGKRKDKKSDDEDNDNHPSPCLLMDPEKDEGTKMTLSGVLNFIDGLWSACGDERIIIFTTNNKDKLDPALIRRGRMDMHIEMSYCRFEAFKVLAKNYLDVEEHKLFSDIRRLLEGTEVAPADVAENLMLTSSKNKGNPDTCLERLVEALEKAHEEKKAMELADAKGNQKQAADAKGAQDDAEAAEVKEGRKEEERKDKTWDYSEAAKMDRASRTGQDMTTMASPSLMQADIGEWVLDTSSLIHYTSNLGLLHELATDDLQANQLQRGSVQTERFEVPEVSYVQGGSSSITSSPLLSLLAAMGW